MPGSLGAWKVTSKRICPCGATSDGTAARERPIRLGPPVCTSAYVLAFDHVVVPVFSRRHACVIVWPAVTVIWRGYVELT